MFNLFSTKIAEARVLRECPTLSLIDNVSSTIINPFLGLMIGLGLVYFLWGVVQFLKNADNEKERDVGKQHIVYGLIGLTIMIGALGILGIIKGFIGTTCG